MKKYDQALILWNQILKRKAINALQYQHNAWLCAMLMVTIKQLCLEMKLIQLFIVLSWVSLITSMIPTIAPVQVRRISSAYQITSANFKRIFIKTSLWIPSGSCPYKTRYVLKLAITLYLNTTICILFLPNSSFTRPCSNMITTMNTLRIVL